MYDQTPAPTTPTEDRRRGTAVVIGVLGAIAAVLVLTAGALFVLRSGRTDATAVQSAAANRLAAPGTTAVAPAADPQPAADQVTEAPAPDAGSAGQVVVNVPTGGGSTSGGSTGGGNGGGAPKPTTPPAPKPPTTPAPAVTSVNAPSSIDCHNGNSQGFSISWTSANATKTTLAVDGPGIYATYGPSGSQQLTFDCHSAHTYTIVAFSADGRTASKTITLQPRNVQPPSTPDTDQ
ncbi:MAG: hypothetical protein U0Q07_17350 [Acidimicrobiales bacterium]